MYSPVILLIPFTSVVVWFN